VVFRIGYTIEPLGRFHMPKRLAATVLALFLSSVSLAVKKSDLEATPVMPDVTARGRALYEYDQASWHSTDAVQALSPPNTDVGRYIARKSDTGWKVAFGHLSEARDKFLVAYEASQGATLQEYTVKKLDPPLEDKSFYLAAAKALDTVLKDFRGEKRPYNVAVLPATSDQLYVYVLPAQTKTGIYPLGGDVRYLLKSDGEAIIEKRQMHKTILENDLSAGSKGSKSIAGFHTHVLSDVPEDTDVFYVLTRQPPQPEYVGTMNKKIYVINPDGTILEGKL
jgi:hypothetical protein